MAFSPYRALVAGPVVGALVVAGSILSVVGDVGPSADHSETYLLQLGALVGALLGLVISAGLAVGLPLGLQMGLSRPLLTRLLLPAAVLAGLCAGMEFHHYFEQAYKSGGSLGDHGGFAGLDEAARIGLPVGGIKGMFAGLLLGLAYHWWRIRRAPEGQDEDQFVGVRRSGS